MDMPQPSFIRTFSPVWFGIVMGTGATALVLDHFATWFPFLKYFAICLWSVDVVLFLLFSGLLIARLCSSTTALSEILKNPMQAFFLGAIPMALLTNANGFMPFGIPLLGHQIAMPIAIACWWVALGLSLLTVWLLPFTMFLIQKNSLQSITPLCFLPIVACTLVAASGGMFIPMMAVTIQQITFLFCIILLAFSLFLTLILITVFFQRLIIDSLLSAPMAPAMWLLPGLLGIGALSLITLTHAATVIGSNMIPSLRFMATMLPGFGLLSAIILWGFAFWWLITALISTLYQFNKGLNFSLSWWMFTFPLGMFTLATFAIADVTKILFFTIMGILCAMLLFIFWVVVAGKTIIGVSNRSLFAMSMMEK